MSLLVLAIALVAATAAPDALLIAARHARLFACLPTCGCSQNKPWAAVRGTRNHASRATGDRHWHRGTRRRTAWCRAVGRKLRAVEAAGQAERPLELDVEEGAEQAAEADGM